MSESNVINLIAGLSLTYDAKKDIKLDQKYSVCPYDKTHLVLPIRLAAHLTRCARNHPNSKLVRCPFNITHLVEPEKFQDHLINCENRAAYDRFKNPDMLPPVEPRASKNLTDDSSENWDDEPHVSSYNPKAYCEKNVIIRNLQGATKSERRRFRESERQRVNELQNKK